MSFDANKETIFRSRSFVASAINYVEALEIDANTVQPTIADYVNNSSPVTNFGAINSPDSCPWGKRCFNGICIHNGVIYFGGFSQLYGPRNIASKFNISELGDLNSIKLLPNSWYLLDVEENLGISWNQITQIRTGNTSRFIGWASDNKIYEITFENFTDANGNPQQGRRKKTLLNVTPPATPAGYTIMQKAYDPIRNRFYYIVRVTDEPGFDMFDFLLYWENGVFSEVRDNPDFVAKNTAYQVNGYIIGGTYQNTYNWFIDSDGSAYIPVKSLSYAGGSHDGRILKVDLSSANICEFYSNDTVSTSMSYEQGVIGWDRDVGYYITNSNSGNTLPIKVGKGFGLTPEKTIDEVFNGQGYNVALYPTATVGLIAFALETKLFLGGKPFLSEVMEVALLPNTVNRIYLENVNSELRILVRDRLIGGERAHDRVLVSEITTDQYNVIGQIDYPVYPAFTDAL